MSKPSQSDIRRYLLRDPTLTLEARAAIEESYFGNDARYQALLEIEDELIDAYVFQRLPPEIKALFEASLQASPRWQEKVALAQSLGQYAAQTSSAPVPTLRGWPPRLRRLWSRHAFRWVAAGSTVAVILMLGFLIRNLWLIQQSNPGVNDLLLSAEQPRGTVPPPPIFSFALTPDLVRGNGKQTDVGLPAGQYTVSLQIRRDGDPYVSYDVTLATPEGRVLLERTVVPMIQIHERNVTLSVPSSALQPGVYILNLKARSAEWQLEDLDDYTFRVLRQ